MIFFPAVTRLSGPSLVFLSSLSSPFPSLNQLKIVSPLSHQTDWTSQTFESQFMELTFSFTDNSPNFAVIIVLFLQLKYCVKPLFYCHRA